MRLRHMHAPPGGDHRCSVFKLKLWTVLHSGMSQPRLLGIRGAAVWALSAFVPLLQRHLQACSLCQGRGAAAADVLASYAVTETDDARLLLPKKQNRETPLGQQQATSKASGTRPRPPPATQPTCTQPLLAAALVPVAMLSWTKLQPTHRSRLMPF